MASIIINRDAFRIDELELEHGELSVGRNPDNDIYLKDSAISGHHAKFVTLFNVSYIKDLGSKNGTYVNGKQTPEHSLHNGDVITIGNYQLMYVSKEEAAVADSNETMMLDRTDLDKLIAESKAKVTSKPVGIAAGVKNTVSVVAQTSQLDSSVRKRNIPPANEDELNVLQNVKTKLESAKQVTGNKPYKSENSQPAQEKANRINKPVDNMSQSSASESSSTEEPDEKLLSPFAVNLLIFAVAVIAVILLFMFRAS